MALVRCENHGNPQGRKLSYVHSVKPVGWPQSAAVCGREVCTNPGFIWLTEAESREYDMGGRVFGFNNASVKIRAE